MRKLLSLLHTMLLLFLLFIAHALSLLDIISSELITIRRVVICSEVKGLASSKYE